MKAQPSDIESIDLALRKENFLWIRTALQDGLNRAKGAISNVEATDSESVSDSEISDIYSSVMHEISSQLLHEIEPMVGGLRVHASREISEFEKSATKHQLDLLDSLLSAISDLRKASAPPRLEELDLSSVIREACKHEARGHEGITIQLAGPNVFPATADRARLWMALTNGIRNAIESSEALDASVRQPIVINWNRTDTEFWISVLDCGVGLKDPIEHLFEIRVSTKANHLGMGLATARQAMMSISGTATISQRENVGVKFELRWPRLTTKPA
ncbi:MAG TPA: ATP-binding protein [Terriglobales bacterium]|nr:ATP-binding protein [Terriglobales bacterium]